MKIISISNINLETDNGDAHAIRTKLLHKGLEKKIDLEIFSYSTAQHVEKQIPSGKYLFSSNLGKIKIAVYINHIVNSFYFIFFLCRIKRQTSLLIDKLPINLVIPFIFFKLFRKNKVIAQYHEFLIYHSPPSKLYIRYIKDFHYCLLKILLKAVDFLIVISHEHSKYYKKFLKKEAQILIVPILIDASLSITCRKIDDFSRFKICYAGAISKSNGIELLLEAIKNNSKLELLIFGPSDKTYFEILKHNYFSYSNIKFEKAKSNQETKIVLSQQDLLVIPKIQDLRSVGYIPTKLADFLFSGTPVLATNIGELDKYIIDGHNGYLVKADNLPEMREKINNISLKSVNELRSIGENGILTSKMFHYEKQVESILSEIFRNE
ncbi:glycosyltransferase [Nonlabens antarcticus]|uniref:glycosyltransferase n=1 Tax=Nonlabens antarcticus TaxID=392714 RepID=UPI0018914CD5|nr:glycosyltransferase [Nonlabens antarcticus]